MLGMARQQGTGIIFTGELVAMDPVLETMGIPALFPEHSDAKGGGGAWHCAQL